MKLEGESEAWSLCFLAALAGRASSSAFYSDQMAPLVRSAATIADEAEKLLAQREKDRFNRRKVEARVAEREAERESERAKETP